ARRWRGQRNTGHRNVARPPEGTPVVKGKRIFSIVPHVFSFVSRKPDIGSSIIYSAFASRSTFPHPPTPVDHANAAPPLAGLLFWSLGMNVALGTLASSIRKGKAGRSATMRGGDGRLASSLCSGDHSSTYAMCRVPNA